MFGPNVQIYTATHPLDSEERKKGLESAQEIQIGDDVWIGGAAIIFLPGVEIGSESVVGAGSVVTKNIPKNVFAAGNPCKVIKSLYTQENSFHHFYQLAGREKFSLYHILFREAQED